MGGTRYYVSTPEYLFRQNMNALRAFREEHLCHVAGTPTVGVRQEYALGGFERRLAPLSGANSTYYSTSCWVGAGVGWTRRRGSSRRKVVA